MAEESKGTSKILEKCHFHLVAGLTWHMQSFLAFQNSKALTLRRRSSRAKRIWLSLFQIDADIKIGIIVETMSRPDPLAERAPGSL